MNSGCKIMAEFCHTLHEIKQNALSETWTRIADKNSFNCWCVTCIEICSVGLCLVYNIINKYSLYFVYYMPVYTRCFWIVFKKWKEVKEEPKTKRGVTVLLAAPSNMFFCSYILCVSLLHLINYVDMYLGAHMQLKSLANIVSAVHRILLASISWFLIISR